MELKFGNAVVGWVYHTLEKFVDHPDEVVIRLEQDEFHFTVWIGANDEDLKNIKDLVNPMIAIAFAIANKNELNIPLIRLLGDDDGSA